MNPYLRWTLRVVAQFVVAGGLIRALDAWIVHLDDRWQFTVLAAMQLAVAFANAFLAGPEPGSRAQGSAPRLSRPRIRRPRLSGPDRQLSQPMPSKSPSKPCGSGGRTWNRRCPTLPQARSGGGGGMQTPG